MHTGNASLQPVVGQQTNYVPSQRSCPPGQLPDYRISSFSNTKDMIAHMTQVAWSPVTGYYGAPVTKDDLELCTSKIYNALVDIREVWDKEDFPVEFMKFHAGGDCSNPRDLETTAILLVNHTVRIHQYGMAGFMFRRASVKPPQQYDIDLTFSQRLHWVAFLLQRYKQHAFRVMCQLGVETYIGYIWTILMSHKRFSAWIRSLSEHQRHMCLDMLPYVDITSNNMPVIHPSAYLKQQRAMRRQVAAEAALSAAPQPQQQRSSTCDFDDTLELLMKEGKQPVSATIKSEAKVLASQYIPTAPASAIENYSKQFRANRLRGYAEPQQGQATPEVKMKHHWEPGPLQGGFGAGEEIDDSFFEAFLNETDNAYQG